MKKLILFVSVFFIMSTPIFAQDNATYMRKPMSLDVGIPDSDSVYIGGKYLITDQYGVELGTSLLIQPEKKSKNQAEKYSFDIVGAFIYYLSTDRISPFVKAGASIGYRTGNFYKDTDTDDAWFTIMLGGGAEFFVTDLFSIKGQALLDTQISPTVKIYTLTPTLMASFYF